VKPGSIRSDSDISVYDRMVWPEAKVGEWLATGHRRRELRAYLGDAEYEHLRPLAQAAASARRDPDRCVFVLPGIMGSQLSIARESPPDNLLWLDPADFQRGDLLQLAWSPRPVRSCGPVLYTFLPLKFALETAGFTVRCFDHDWRRDIADLGVELSRRIAIEPARHISLVGHSMGGLIARAALRTDAGSRIERLITLGTPHGGSYAPVQALRGVYPLIRRLAQLDARNSAEVLARDVFATFHSLYQMLPRDEGLNLLDARNWPSLGPQPNATLLDRVALLDLGGADPRIGSIAGYGYDTPLNVTRVRDDFYYRYGAAGDGTVPTARATLAGAEAWYCKVAHNELPRSPLVHAAVLALLGEVRPELPGAPPALVGQPRLVCDQELRTLFNSKIDWSTLDVVARRRFLDSLNASPPPIA
jgi:pimeloyl-ACP methyl ester carboxylesterase